MNGEYWRQAAERAEARVIVACRALGALEFLTGPDFEVGYDGEQLDLIRDAVAELRTGLAVTPLSSSAASSTERAGEAA